MGSFPSWFLVLRCAGLVEWLWNALVGSGVIAVGKWFETKRSGIPHNFVLSVAFQNRPVKWVVRVEVGRLKFFGLGKFFEERSAGAN